MEQLRDDGSRVAERRSLQTVNCIGERKKFLARGFIVFLFNETHFQSESINTVQAARFSAAMLDHDTDGLLQAIVGSR